MLRIHQVPLRGLALAWLALLGSPGGTLAQPYSWEEIGPRGGTTSFLAVDPSSPGTLYAGTDGGIWRSTDGAVSWAPTAFSEEPIGFAVDPLSPGTLYAGLFVTVDCPGPGCVEVFFHLRKSTDAGGSWSTVYSSGPAVPPISERTPVAVDPHAAGTVYLGGFLKSVDGGASWDAVGAGLPPLGELTNLVLDPGAAGVVYMGFSGDGVFKSTDGGLTYAPASVGLTDLDVVALAIDPGTPTTLYAGTAGGIFKTTNGGATWSAINLGLTSLAVKALAVDPVDSVTVYAGMGSASGAAIFRSANGGATWERHDRGLAHAEAASDAVMALAADPGPPSRVYVGTTALGTFWSSNAACSWTMSNRGVGEPIEHTSVAIDPASPTTLYAGSYKSTNQGKSWRPLASLREIAGAGPRLAMDPFVSSTIYAGRSQILTPPFSPSAALRSEDAGATWTASTVGLPVLSRWRVLVPDPVVPGRLYLGSDDYSPGVWTSVDGGASWGGPGTSPAVNGFAVDPVSPLTLYASSFGIGVFKSIDGGTSWSSANNGLANLIIRGLAMDPQDPLRLYTASNDVYVTADGAASWTAASPLPPGLFVEAIAVNPVTSMVYVGGQGDSEVVEGGPGGASWADISAGFPGIGPTTLEVEPGTGRALYAAGHSMAVARLQLVACAVDADCDDANACTLDTCSVGTGACVNTTVGNGAPCDDGNPCSVDVCVAGACQSAADPACGCGAYCAPAPIPGCIGSGTARLLVNAKKAGRESLKVALKKLSGPTTQSDFGDPVTGATAYGICVYDQSDILVGSLAVARAGAPCGAAQTPCWVAPADGYAYRDGDGESDGIQQIVAKGGGAGKGRLTAKGRNAANRGRTSLPVGVAAALAGSASATVQVVTDDASCFGATLTNVRTADGLRFKASGP